MLGFEELLLANLLVRKGLVPAAEVQLALENLDRQPGRGDLYGSLAARGGTLAQPDMREKAMASVQRYMFTKREAAFAARARTSGAVPPAVLDATIAEQQREGLSWSLADRLVKQGKLSTVRRALIEKDATTDLRAQEAQLVAKHRNTRFQETVGNASISGKRTAEYAAGTLDSSGEAFKAFGTTPGPSSDADAGEKTLQIPPPRGARPAAAEADPSVATLIMSPHAAAGMNDDQGQTVKLAPPAPPRKAPVAPGPLSAGQVLLNGKYTIVSELGRGGMGVVYRAKASDRPDDVAFKAVSAIQTGTQKSVEVLGRFKREILTATLVSSENVCEVYDAGQAPGIAYMAMELIEGEELRDLIGREAPLAPARAVELISQVLRGVAACHGVHVIHRDLKPENVRITTKDGREVAKIVDFGIARLLTNDTKIAEQVFVTMKGTLSGTPAYVAPELVLEPDLVDLRADLYSIGVILYELLTGKLPFLVKATVRETLRDAIEGRPVPLAEAIPGRKVSPELERVLFRLLEKDQLVRYQSADEVLAALVATTAPPAPPPRQGITARIMRIITSIFRKKA